MPLVGRGTEGKPLRMQIFLSFCIPWPQGSTCPPAVHCWQLDFSGPWWTVVGTMSLKTLPRSPLPCVTLGEGLRVSGRKVGLVDRNRCFCVFRVGAVGSRRRGCRASLPADWWKPLGEGWIFQNLDVPYFDGEASGAVLLSTPFPSRVFPFVYLL